MSEQHVVAVYSDFQTLREGIQRLTEEGFGVDELSLVTRGGEQLLEEQQALAYGDKSASRAAQGAGLGGLIGVLVSAPLLTIPGIGPLLVAGPIASGLTGAIVGGFLGGMSGWGVPQDRVQEYEEKVRSGKLILIVHGDPQRTALARELLEPNAEELHYYAKTSSDSPEIDD